MARVRMRFHISGGRQVDLEHLSFAEWPEAGGILECGDSEAAELIRGGMADPVEDDGEILPVPAATPEPAARTETPEGEGTSVAKKPVQARTAPTGRQTTVKP